MRKALIAGLTVALAASLPAYAQETASPLAPGDVAPASPGVGDDAAAALEPPLGPQPGDPAPPPPPAEPQKKSRKMDVAGTAGGALGGMLAKGAGTAVAGPVGGIAAGFIGNRVGRGAVGLVKRVIGGGDRKDDAAAAPDLARDVSANVPEPVGLSEFTPAAAADPAPGPAEPND
jgi:hypothetical protein